MGVPPCAGVGDADLHGGQPGAGGGLVEQFAGWGKGCVGYDLGEEDAAIRGDCGGKVPESMLDGAFVGDVVVEGLDDNEDGGFRCEGRFGGAIGNMGSGEGEHEGGGGTVCGKGGGRDCWVVRVEGSCFGEVSVH